ncbi:MAG: hypothetical protein H7Y60_04165 [Rhodospirillaceae bacterium]|nr:hypothetical protein [Rhodospirillales bacterium]
MALIHTNCVHTQVGAIKEMAEEGNLGKVRVQLTSMLRCAGKLACGEAVPCSDQAMNLLRSLVLPDGHSD